MIHQVTNKKKSIAVIGANGFVGSNICSEIKSQGGYKLIKVTRGDNIADKVKDANIVIHAANPAKRYFANNNPQIDFLETVQKTEKIINLCQSKKINLCVCIARLYSTRTFFFVKPVNKASLS